MYCRKMNTNVHIGIVCVQDGGKGKSQESLTLSDALHELFIGLKPYWTGVMTLAMEEVQVSSTSGTCVPLQAQLTAYRTF